MSSGPLAGRVVVVTGGGAGLGRSIALGLADRGAAVAVVGPSPGGAGGVAGGVAVAATFSSRLETEAAFATVAGRLGPLDAVVHAWADPLSVTATPLAELDEAGWDARCEAVLRATLWCCQAAFTHFHDRGGRVVLITPTLGLTGQAGLAPYAAAVEGQRAMAKAAARQWGSRGMTLNCVAPPAGLMGGDAGAALAHRALGRDPDGRNDVAAVVALLLADDAHFVTGATIAVDGGVVMAP